MIVAQVFLILVKLIAFIVGVVLIIGGMFRMRPHPTSGSVYLNVLLVFLGSFVLLVGIMLS